MLERLASRRFGLPADSTAVVTWVVVALLAVAAGVLVPPYVSVMGDSLMKLAALPVALFLTFFLLASRSNLLRLIILVRASGDVVFESTRFGIGGAEIGVGGLLNGFVILIALMLVLEQPARFKRELVRAWGWFLAIAFVGIIFSPDPGAAIRLYLQLLSTFAVFVGGWYLVESKNDFKKCVKLIVWSSVVPVVYGAYQFATGSGVFYDDAGIRYQSTFSHPNVYAFYLALAISLTFYVLKSPLFRIGGWTKFGIALYLVVLLVMLGLTKTRSAWIAVAAIFFVYGLFFERRYLLYVLGGGVLALFVPGVGDRMLEVMGQQPVVISSYTPLNSFEWRQSIWTSALAWMSPARYLTGYGLEAFPALSTTFFAESNNIHYGAHNDYVQVFFELGAIGVLAFIGLYLDAIRLARGLFRTDRLAGFVTVALVVEYLVVAASDNMMQYLSFNWYVWFLLGAGAALAVQSQAARAETKSP